MTDQQSLMQHMLMDAVSYRATVPTDFHGQVRVIKKMLSDDITGIIDSLTDFSVQSATVDYNIEVENKKLSKILKTWLKDLNREYNGRVPSGIQALATEYFKERWKNSSFPVLKIAKWAVEADSGLILPTKMYFLDGGSLYAKDNYPKTQGLHVDQYDYSIGNGKSTLKSNVIFSKCSGRWFDKYPIPYLIKRGVYRNFEIISSLKRNQQEVLDQVIPYLLHIKKNTEKLAIEKNNNYDATKLNAIVDQITELMKKTKGIKNTEIKSLLNTPIRVTQFDEEIKHLVPDLKDIFEPTLFSGAEKNILSGLGFIDVVDGASTTRRESILNPRPFIQEVQRGVKDFKQLLTDLLYMVKVKNIDNKKYKNFEAKVTSSPVQGFMSDKFKARMVTLWEKGVVSSQTLVEVVGETQFEVEVARRSKETKDGIDVTMYPRLDENKEDKGKIDIGPNDDNIDNKNVQVQEKKNLNKAALDQAMLNIKNPYPTIRSLPDAVKDRIKGISKRRKWLKIFDAVFNFYKGKDFTAERAEDIAFATAWEKFDSKNNKPKDQNEK